jgi:hypothetical protein
MVMQRPGVLLIWVIKAPIIKEKNNIMIHGGGGGNLGRQHASLKLTFSTTACSSSKGKRAAAKPHARMPHDEWWIGDHGGCHGLHQHAVHSVQMTTLVSRRGLGRCRGHTSTMAGSSRFSRFMCRYDPPTTTFTVSFKLYMTKSSFSTTFFNIIYNFCMHQASWCFNFQGLDFHCTASGDYSVLFVHNLER